jgi:hypothetical protein
MFLIKRLIPSWITRREWLLIAIGAACGGSRRHQAQNERFTGSTPVDRQRTVANLKLIAWALYNYHDAHGCFPPQAIIGKDGQPLLSWRVAILPFLAQPDYYLRFRREEPWDSKHNVQSFLAQKKLYARFRCDEPWDSKHNKKLLRAMPEAYAPAAEIRRKKSGTFYQGFVGAGTVFEQGRSVTYADITDGTVNTLSVVEGPSSVPWTRPEDLRFDKEGPLPSLGGHNEQGFHVLTCDGAVHFVRKDIDPNLLRLAITRNDGEPVVGRWWLGHTV